MTNAAGVESTAPAVAETHISTVFFTKDRAYKIMKPLATSFLDHSTAEARLEAVDQELLLNRRMAPDVYLGTADVVENGEIVDRMLVMRRLPASRRLTWLIDQGVDVSDCIRSIARAIAVFHSAQEPMFDSHDVAGPGALKKNWSDNFADIEPMIGAVIPVEEALAARTYVDTYLNHSAALFEGRIADGLVRDGHGDLTAEDTFCLDDGPRILDCLAFDPRLRIADVLLDVAFLAMDLERLEHPKLAEGLVDFYCEFSNEHHPRSLAHHYVAYRASVRTKVAAIRFGQGDAAQAELVRTYHRLCLRHLEQAALRLILVGGSPGTGKSTLAKALSNELGHAVLSSDELRKDLSGLGHLDRDFAGPDEGIYSPDVSERTYDEMVRRAGLLLDRAESVILDASWNSVKHRERARTMAAEKGAAIIELECTLDAALARKRLVDRLEAGNDPSDARPELLNELRQRFEPWPTATPVDTSAPPAAVAGVVIDEIATWHRA